MPTLQTTLISLTPPTLPVNYCPGSYQTLANDLIGQTVAQFRSTAGNLYYNTGSSAPTADNRIYPWLDTDGNWWVWSTAYTAWIRINPSAAGSSERRIWVGSTTALLSYDGGDGTSTVYAAAGPMWEVDTTMSAVFPVGVGTFAASGLVGVNQTTTSTGVVGEDKHTLIQTEMPSHNHNMTWGQQDTSGGDQQNTLYNGASNPNVGDANKLTELTGGDSNGNTVAHNNLPPFYGVYFIKRTARIYYAK
ncbi:MAG: hypothetical protein WCG75_00025 [Armatimonadota bacterium]